MSKLNKEEKRLKVILDYVVKHSLHSPEDSIRDIVNEALLVCRQDIYMDKNHVIVKDE